MKTLKIIVALAFAQFLLIGNSHAALMYQVSDTSVVNCSNSPHGLWTSGSVVGGSCSNYFSISGIFSIDNSDADSANWTGSLEATATNPPGCRSGY